MKVSDIVRNRGKTLVKEKEKRKIQKKLNNGDKHLYYLKCSSDLPTPISFYIGLLHCV